MGRYKAYSSFAFWVFQEFFSPKYFQWQLVNTRMQNSWMWRTNCIAFFFLVIFSRQCHLLVKSSNERAFNAFHVKITRNTLGVEQIGFLAHGHKREHTPRGTVEFLIKKKNLQDLALYDRLCEGRALGSKILFWIRQCQELTVNL